MQRVLANRLLVIFVVSERVRLVMSVVAARPRRVYAVDSSLRQSVDARLGCG